MRIARWMTVACIMVAAGPALRADSIWELQAVDANGEATHPKVGASPVEANKVTVEGIALNRSEDYLDPGLMFQLYVQAEAPDAGGIAAWSGCFFQGGPGSQTWADEFARMTQSGFEPGDRVRVEGFAAFHRGKTNINERHSAAPAMDFTISVLDEDVGMPALTVIPSVGSCNYFDETRAGGGELYQATWCRLDDVWIESMPDGWGAGKTVFVTDNGTDTLPVLLSGMGDFDGYAAPGGPFSVTGIFDQEDESAPFTGSYRLWVKNYGALGQAPVPEPAGCALLAIGLGAVLVSRRRRRA
ncbi:MAG: PEP-CTERM sorting domain-containing protein [bacterium]